MHSYSDLLEQRTALQSKKSLAFSNCESKEVIHDLQQQIDALSILIRSYNFDETPTQLLSEPEWYVQDDFIPVVKPTLGKMSYENFYSWNRDKIMKQITAQLISIEVPIGVYAIFKNAVVKSEDYIMKHHYNIYCSEVEEQNNE